MSSHDDEEELWREAADIIMQKRSISDLPQSIEDLKKKIAIKKIERLAAVSKQTNRFKIAVQTVQSLTGEFQSLRKVTNSARRECSDVGFDDMEDLKRVKQIAFVKENLTHTVQEIDRYREIPKTSLDLINNLKVDKEKHLPRAHYEFRDMMAWSHNSQMSWEAATAECKRRKQERNFTDDTLAQMVTEHEEQARQFIQDIREKIQELGYASKTAIYGILASCFELAVKQPHCLVLVADMIETSSRQRAMITALESELERISRGSAYGDVSIISAELRKRTINWRVADIVRVSCFKKLDQACQQQCQLRFVEGMKMYHQKVDGGLSKDDKTRLENGNELEFDEVMSGLDHAAATFVADTEAVSVCFPPWYNLRDLFVRSYAVACLNRLYKHICDDDAVPAEGGDGDGAGAGDFNEEMLKNISNDRIVSVVSWLRGASKLWGAYVAKHESHVHLKIQTEICGIFNKKKKKDVPTVACTVACTDKLIQLSDNCVKVYLNRVKQNVIKWSKDTSRKIPQDDDVDFVDGKYPHTLAPRDLCRLLDDQYRYIMHERAFTASELVNFGMEILSALDDYCMVRKDPHTLSWLKDLDVDNQIVVLCAMIHDFDFLEDWMQNFCDVVDEMQVKKIEEGEIGETTSSKKSLESLESYMVKFLERQEEIDERLQKGRYYFADALAVAVFGVLTGGGVPSKSVEETLRMTISPKADVDDVLQLFPIAQKKSKRFGRSSGSSSSSSSKHESNATESETIVTSSIFDEIFTQSWINNDTCTVETISKTLIDFLTQGTSNEFPTVFSMLRGVFHAAFITRVVNHLMKFTSREYTMRYLHLDRLGDDSEDGNNPFRRIFHRNGGSISHSHNHSHNEPTTTEMDELLDMDDANSCHPAADRLHLDCDLLLTLFNDIKGHIQQGHIQQKRFHLDVESEFCEGIEEDSDGKIGRVRILANLLAIHQLNTEELDDLFADVLSVERDLEELKDPMALIGDKKSSLGRQLIRIAVKVSVHLTKKKRKKILQEADKFWASPKDHGKTKALDESRQVQSLSDFLQETSS